MQWKGSVNAAKKWKLLFQSRRWNSQNPWRRSTSETIHFNQGSSWTRRGTRSFSRKIRRTLFSYPNSNSTLDDAEAKNDFWSIAGDFIYRHHVEPRVKLYMPKEESFPIPLKYVDVTRTTHTSLDLLLEEHIDDYWNVDGERELSDAYGPEGDLRGNKQPQRPANVWPDMCGSICLMSQKKQSGAKVCYRETKAR